MAEIVKVLLNDGRVLPFVNHNLSLQSRMNVIVNLEGVEEFGVVQYKVKTFDKCNENKILRIATKADIEKNAQLKSFEKEDKNTVLERVNLGGLQLSLVSVLRSFDSKKILVMYTAQDRVDFRNLVRELAGIFKMRVEMRQISERDAVRVLGDCGVCGQTLCCRRFENLKTPAIKMAKTQGKSLMPNKVNGVCGKTMCCLCFEQEQYQEVLSKFPPIGSRIKSKDGEGNITEIDCLKEEAVFKLDDGNVCRAKVGEFSILSRAVEVDDD